MDFFQNIPRVHNCLNVLTIGAWRKKFVLCWCCIYWFSKAFDSLCHSKLISKLEAFGFGCKVLAWIQNYLSNRTQRVKEGSSLSSFVSVISGVPQGSVLFLLYINDLVDVFGDFLSVKLFADDVKVWDRKLPFPIDKDHGLYNSLYYRTGRDSSWPPKGMIDFYINIWPTNRKMGFLNRVNILSSASDKLWCNFDVYDVIVILKQRR